LTFGGYVRVRQGEVALGMPMIDEGMTWAVSGQVSPLPAQLVFCRTISTCYELGDYRRAGEWMDAIAECSAQTGINSLPGDCEAHSIGILIGRGAWSEGERRARGACAGMEPFELVHVGLALSEIGEIRLRMGDLEGAAEAFAKASENAAPPQPGTALLLLARGDIAGAGASIDRAYTRALLARALFEQGERSRAQAELQCARTTFESLGARLDLAGLAPLAAALAAPS
jgi:tetratricopeptide (TPR) repeat protein